jgi:hypothetical protein
MAGDTGLPVERAFPFRVPSPSIPVDFGAKLLDAYARERDRDRRSPPRDAGRACFLGSRPVIRGGSLFWRWRLGDQGLRLPRATEQVADLLLKASRPGGLNPKSMYRELEDLLGNGPALKVWKTIRAQGLVIIP